MTTVERPWYISLLLGVAGWLAGIFLLVFVVAVFSPDSGPGALVMGAALLGAAYGLFRVDKEGAFLSQLALALSIAAQFAMLYAVHKFFFNARSESIATIAFAGVVVQAILIPLMPNRLHRTMSTLFLCIAWAVFVRQTFGKDQPVIGWFVAWGPAMGALFLLVQREGLATPIANGLVVALGFATLISHPFESFRFLSGPKDLYTGWLTLWPLLSALASLGALVAAFALRSRGLVGLCVLAALLHMAHFYYAMGVSLLVKSLVMMVMGAACLGAAWWLKEERAP